MQPHLFRIRTVTAFLSLQASDFPSPPSQNPDTIDHGALQSSLISTLISLASNMLRTMESELKGAGYEVQTLRIATNPFGEWILPATEEAEEKEITLSDVEIVKFRLACLDKLLADHNIGFCALGPACTKAEMEELCVPIVASSPRISCSANLKAGDYDTALAAATCIQQISKLQGASTSSSSSAGLDNFRFCVTGANCKAHIPFFPAAKNSADKVGFAVGLENGALAYDLLQQTKYIAHIPTIFRTGMAHALQPVQDICVAVATQHSYTYLGIDTSLNPSLDAGGSVAEAIESLLEVDSFGGPGTIAAAAAITTALQSLPGIQLVGYCGLMLPVCEDERLAALAVRSTTTETTTTTTTTKDRLLTITDLLSISSVCGVGIDTVPLAGDVSKERLASLLLDMAGLAARWDKSLSCRVLPFPGKQVGGRTDFDSPYMVNTEVFDL